MRFYRLLALACAVGAAVLTQSTTARADGWADTLNYRRVEASAPAADPRRARTELTVTNEPAARRGVRWRQPFGFYSERFHGLRFGVTSIRRWSDS